MTGTHRRLDRYELLAEIASGGMGTVLLARLGGAGGFERLFAIKVMHPHLMANPQFVGMLLEEARLAAKIHHPNVVATVDVGQRDSFYYIVMDYVDGFPLARILDGGLFNRQERIRIVNRVLLDVMSGLHAAHTLRGPDGGRLGIVHRDVSPQNVLIGADGVARLTDFGIAQAASQLSVSRVDAVKGKPSYLAPEQATGKAVDLRADLWALGIILWEGITGRRLFVAETEADTVDKVLSEPIPSPAAYYADVPADLEALCLRALDRDPSRRPTSAREMFFELERIADESGLLATTHEVSDLLRDRLGAEIDGRRRALQRYGAPPGVEVLPASMRDLQALPKLTHDDVPAARERKPPAVGLATMPASRSMLRTTPAGTSAESPPSNPRRRLTGVFALLALFALGSATTLALTHFRFLDPLGPGATAVAVGTLGDDAQGESAPEDVGALARAASAPEPSAEPAPPNTVASPVAQVIETERAVEATPMAVVPSSSDPTTSSVTPSAAAQAVRSGPVTAPSVSRSRARPARSAVEKAPSAPVLPVEENPYRLQ